jgi:hypothetical protein
MTECKKLAELDLEKRAEVLDMIDRMHSGRPKEPDLSKKIDLSVVTHCPYHHGEGEISEACESGCQIEKLMAAQDD